MEPIKNGIVTLLQVGLWLTFLCALGDPGIMGERPPDSLYASYNWIFDNLYKGTGYLIYPAKLLFEAIRMYDPNNAGAGWFPVTTPQELAELTKQQGLATAFAGVIIWWIPLTSALLAGASMAFGYLFEQFKNFFWNIIIEYLFQRKKAKMYEQALNQRNEDLQKLNNQYRVLAQETHSLKDSVITDELTKVFNKRFFLSRLQQEFDTCKKEKRVLSIIMIDIDFFKKLNDTYGHLAGDNVLKAVAMVLKRFVPDQCYPCRYGGEEFSIIMPSRTINEAIEAARLIQENVQLLRFDDIDPKLRVTVSQGICTVDFASDLANDVKQFDQILQLADQELYRSKMEGRNRVSVNARSGQKPA